MRVAHVTLDGNLPRYGIGLAVVSLARALAARGHHVTLLGRAANVRTLSIDGVRVAPLEKRWSLLGGAHAYVRQIRAAVKDGVDVVHVHGLSRAAWWLRGPRARRDAALVVTAHAADELGPSASAAGDAPASRARRHGRQIRRVLSIADAVVAPSRWMAGQLASVCSRAVDVIGLGPTDEAPVEPESHAGFAVVALARLVPVKGIDLLLEAFCAAMGEDRTARLVLAGDGPLGPLLAERARSLGVAERVSLVGYVDGEARRRLLASADLVVVPTRGHYETFGLAALDGSAAGVAIVVANGGALPERVEHGEGVAVAAGDVNALAAALTRLRNDANERRTMAAAGRVTATNNSWNAVAVAHERVYERTRAIVQIDS